MWIFMRRILVLAGGLSAFLAISHLPVQAALIFHYKFDETGTTAPGSLPGLTTAVTMRNDAGTATDLHSADGGGVTGLAGDRSYANLGPNDHGSVASAATN